MLHVSVDVIGRGTPLILKSVIPGEKGGSFTDYSVPNTQILLFFHDYPEYAELKVSKEGATIKQGDMRVTLPTQGLELIKIIKVGENFEYPFTSKYGKAILKLEVR